MSDSPGGGRHDAAAPLSCHPATAAPLWRVVVHTKVVAELVGQSHGGAQRVLRVVLQAPAEKNFVFITVLVLQVLLAECL